MKLTFSPWQLLTLAVVVLPGLYLAYTWPALPNQIPTHFGADGQANGFTAKQHMWLPCIALPLGLYLLLLLLPRLDPKHRLATESANFQKLTLALVGLTASLNMLSLYTALHPQKHPGQLLVLVLGLFFALIGNYLTTVPPNYFVGIRTPWALEFPDNWARTHRLAGRLFFVTGLLSVALGLVWPGEVAIVTLLSGVLGTALVAYVYSYWLYRQQRKMTGVV
ncbi:SdpI family protein [Hymenobacter fodinae]|nr:SdpI family protein [Hymenobacter fodinae]